MASRAAAAAADDDNQERRTTNDEHDEPIWRQLDDVLITAAPFDCGGFGQMRASTAPSASPKFRYVNLRAISSSE